MATEIEIEIQRVIRSDRQLEKPRQEGQRDSQI